MADVIREVLIRGRMEIVKAELAVPDIGAFTKTLQEQAKLNQELVAKIDETRRAQEESSAASARAAEERKREREAEQAAREEAKAVAAEKRRQREEERAAALAAAAAAKAAAEAAKKQQDAEREAAEAARAAEEAAREASERANRERRESERLQRQINDQVIKGAEGFRTAVDGAFAFSRGLALIGLDGSSDLEKVVRKVAEVQAKFDLLRGSIDVVKGGIETARGFGAALTAAGGATAVLRRGLLSAGAAVAPLVAALGPTGLIVAGVGAVAAAGALAWKAFGDSAEDARDRSIAALRDATAESGRLARQAQTDELARKLGTRVANAQDALAIANATGTTEEQDAARREVARVTIEAGRQQEAEARARAADPRLTAEETLRTSGQISEARIIRAQAERQGALDEASAVGPRLQRQQEEARRLIAEREALQEEQRGVRSDAFNLDLLGTPTQQRAFERNNQIADRLEEINQADPSGKLADAVEGLAKLQEETNEIVSSLNTEIGFAKADLEKVRAQIDARQAQQIESQ